MNDVVTTDETRAAVEEIRAAHDQAVSILAGDGGSANSNSSLPELSDDQIERLRTRAQKQRTRGRKELLRRHDGIASIVLEVSLKERVIGSSFERFFATIESGISLIERRGEMIVGEKAAAGLIEKVETMLETIGKELEVHEAALKGKMTVASAMPNFVQPQYTGAAAKHQVQIRTRTALGALRLFERYDLVLQDMQVLFWNRHVDQKYIEDMELEAKHAFQKLFKFVSSTIRGMYNKAGGSAPGNRGQAANGVAANVAEGSVAEAA